MASEKRNVSLLQKFRSNFTHEKIASDVGILKSSRTTKEKSHRKSRIESMSSRYNYNTNTDNFQRASSSASESYQRSDASNILSKSIQNPMSTFNFSNLPRLNFRSYNKEALFNLQSDNTRPASDYNWFRIMRKPARSTLYERNHSPYPETIRDYFHTKDRSSSCWKKRNDMNHTINNLNLSSVSGDVFVGPSGKYCGSCRKDKYPLKLSVR